jgi:hypothetical protein
MPTLQKLYLMNYISLALRLIGELPSDEDIHKILGVIPTNIFRKGDMRGKISKTVQPIDVCCLELTPELDHNSSEEEITKQFLQSEKFLWGIAPNLAKVDRDRISVDLWVSCTRVEVRGGFVLPQGLVSAVGAARASINMSILIMLDDD